MNGHKKKSLPEFFRPLFWSYDFEKLNPDKDKLTIVQNVINYGTFDHWRWIKRYYGENKIREALAVLPASCFRIPALKLASLIFKTRNLNYALRSTARRK